MAIPRTLPPVELATLLFALCLAGCWGQGLDPSDEALAGASSAIDVLRSKYAASSAWRRAWSSNAASACTGQRGTLCASAGASEGDKAALRMATSLSRATSSGAQQPQGEPPPAFPPAAWISPHLRPRLQLREQLLGLLPFPFSLHCYGSLSCVSQSLITLLPIALGRRPGAVGSQPHSHADTAMHPRQRPTRDS
jgi:hypothetical protein